MTARTPIFLMANLGSEMSRLFCFRESGDAARAEASAARALKIVAELEERPLSPGLEKELSILKTLILDARTNANTFAVSRADLENYFIPIAVKALRAA